MLVQRCKTIVYIFGGVVVGCVVRVWCRFLSCFFGCGTGFLFCLGLEGCW